MNKQAASKTPFIGIKTHNLLTEICSWVLALVFAYTASSKWIDWYGTQSAFYNQIFPNWTAEILMFSIPPLELFLAISLLIPSTRKVAFAASLVLMVIFTIYVGLIMTGIFGRIPCSCGGIISALGWEEHLLMNILLVVIATIGFLSIRKIHPARSDTE
ncbi:MauE/DoxX family redox-associated membrane protein [Aquiflexum sp.]|uniref:MauE/DoxX family redox-associated membrane protein n=1 Tax=Aquiflexum sp. TaxID=1872584 RepID=UPI003593589E